jgi:hypothetical protein
VLAAVAGAGGRHLGSLVPREERSELYELPEIAGA